MAQTGYTPIKLYYSTTASAAPTAGNLSAGELAINILDEKLYFKNSAGVVKVLASTASVSSVTSLSFASMGFSPSTATSGVITVSGTLNQGYGGTGFSTYTTGDMLYASATNTLSKLTAGSNGSVLVMTAGVPAWSSVSSVGVTTFSAGTTGFTPSTATSGAITLGGTLAATNGGTGQSTYAVGDLLIGGATNTLTKLADVATGNALISGGVGVAPSWGKIALTTHVSGTLPVANGGTGLTTYAVGDIVYASATGTLASLADVATGNVIISGGVGVAPSYGKVGLTTHVSGTLASGNGGTGLTSFTSGGAVYATSTSVLTTGTLPVSAGGTGATSLTANSVILGNGTSAPLGVAPGASGNVLISNGTTWTSSALGTSGVTTISFGTTGLTPATATSGAITVAGTLAVANGGTGVTTAQAEMNRVAGSVASGQYLRGNGTNVVMSTIQAADVPTLNQNTTGTAAGLSSTLAVTSGGTGATALTSGYALIGAGTSAVAGLAPGTAGNVMLSNGTTWTSSAVTLVSSINFGTTGLTPATATSGAVTVAGTLGVANGGTGSTSLTSGYALIGNGTSAVAGLSPAVVGNVMTANGSTWVSATPQTGLGGFEGFVPATITASISGTVMTVTAVSLGALYVGEIITQPAFAGTGSQTGTAITIATQTAGSIQVGSVLTYPSFTGTASQLGSVLSVSAATAGALPVGAVVTLPVFAGTATNSGTTMTVATHTAGALQVGQVVNTNCSFTASKTTTVMSVTAVASGGIHVGMTIFNAGVSIGTVVSFGTGTGGTGTYNMSVNATVAAGARTGTGTATVTALGTGTGSTGTYTINQTYTATVASATTATTASTSTITSFGTGAGQTGTYNVNTSFTAVSSAITAPAATTTVTALGTGTGGTGTYTGSNNFTIGTVAVTGPATNAYITSGGTGTGGTGTYNLSNNLTAPSATLNLNQIYWTIPTGVTKARFTIVGGGGGTGGVNTWDGGSGGGGGGGSAIRFLTGLTAGNTILLQIGFGGTAGIIPAAGNSGSTGGTGGPSSISSGTQTISTVTATGGGPTTFTQAPYQNSAVTYGSGGTGGSASGGNLNVSGSAGLATALPNASIGYACCNTLLYGNFIGSGGASYLAVPASGLPFTSRVIWAAYAPSSTGYGAGGSGLASMTSNANSYVGAAGTYGAIIIEY